MADFAPVGVSAVVDGLDDFLRDMGAMQAEMTQTSRVAEDQLAEGIDDLNDVMLDLVHGIGDLTDQLVDLRGDFREVDESAEDAARGIKDVEEKTETLAREVNDLAADQLQLLKSRLTSVGNVIFGVSKKIVSLSTSIAKTLVNGVKSAISAIIGFGNKVADVAKKVGKFAAVQLRKLGTQFKELGDKVLAASKRIVGFGLNVAKTLAKGVAVGTAAIAGLGVASVKSAISFESAFAGVIKTTDGLTDEFGNLTEVGEEMRQGFRDLSKEIPTTVEELTAIGEIGGQLGIAADDLLDFTEVISAMGVATNLTTEDAAVQFAQLANIMGTTEREGSDAFSKLGSAIVELGNNFATTEADISSFASRIAGAGAIAGLAESDVLAIGAAMSSVGVQAEAGGTAVQKVLLNINEAVLTGSKDLETFAATAGLSATEFADLWETDAAEALTRFVEGLGIAGDEAIFILEDLGLTDQRLTRSFLSLAGAGNLLRDTVEMSSEAWEENSALSKEAAQRYATTESQLRLVKNILNDVAISIGDILLPPLREFLERFREFVNKQGPRIEVVLKTITQAIGRVVDSIAPFKEAILALATGNTEKFLENLSEALETLGIRQDVIDTITTFAKKLGDFIDKVVGFVTKHAEAFKAAFIAIGAVLAGGAIVSGIISIVTAITSLISPINIIIAAIGLLAAAWAEDWGGIRTTITTWWEETGRPIFESLKEWLAVNIPLAIETAKSFWEGTLKPALETVWGFVKENILPIFGDIWAWLEEKIPQAIETAETFWKETLKPALETVWDYIVENIVPIFEDVWAWLEEKIPEAIETAEQFWKETLKPALETVWDYISENIIPIFEDTWAWLKEKIPEAIDEAKVYLEETLKPALETVWEYITENVIPSLEETATKIGERIPEAVIVLEAIWEGILMKALRGLWKFVQDNLNFVLGALAILIMTQVVPAFITWAVTVLLPLLPIVALGAAIIALGLIWDEHGETVKTTLEQLKFIIFFYLNEASTKLQTFIDEGIEGWKTAWKGLQTVVSTVWEEIKTTVSDKVETVKIVLTKIENVLSNISTLISETLSNAWDDLMDKFYAAKASYLEPVKKAFESIKTAIDNIKNTIGGLADKLKNIDLGPFTPGSPTPFEIGLRGIGDALDELSFDKIPAFQSALKSVGRIGGTAAELIGQEFGEIDEEIAKVDERILGLRNVIERIEAGEFPADRYFDLIREINEQEALRSQLVGERIQAEQKIIALQEQQRQIEFLQQQSELLDIIRENQLNAAEILAGLELGIDASAADVADAMIRAMQAMVAQTQAELGITSPSSVFERIGEQIMQGLAMGVQRGGQVVQAATQGMVAGPITSTAVSNVFNTTINGAMDQAFFEQRVLQTVSGALP